MQGSQFVSYPCLWIVVSVELHSPPRATKIGRTDWSFFFFFFFFLKKKKIPPPPGSRRKEGRCSMPVTVLTKNKQNIPIPAEHIPMLNARCIQTQYDIVPFSFLFLFFFFLFSFFIFGTFFWEGCRFGHIRVQTISIYGPVSPSCLFRYYPRSKTSSRKLELILYPPRFTCLGSQ